MLSAESPESMDTTSSNGSNGSRKAKAKRKTYTAREKELVVLADQEGGRKARMEVAHMLGMPARTADKVVSMFREHGKEALHDHRRDRNTHLGQNAKYTVELLRFVMEWLHLDAKLSYAQLRDLVNLEIFRGICHDLNLSFPGEEGRLNRPISPDTIERFFGMPQVREAYAERHVEADETIGRWLDGLVLSRKHLLDDGAAVNSAEDCGNRLTFAQDLLRALEDPNAVIVFVDVVPFHLRMRHPPSLDTGGSSSSSSSSSLVDAGSDADRLSEDARVSMAFNAHMGLLAGDVRMETRLAGRPGAGHDSTSAVRLGALAAQSEADFDVFLDAVLRALDARREALRGKNVYVICDCPADFLRHIEEHQALRSVPTFEQLNAALQAMALDSSVRLIRMAPNSPPLNLGEFFNRRLREGANALLHELVMRPQAHADILGNTKRTPLLQAVLRRALQGVGEDAAAAAPLLVRLVDLCKDVIADSGRLDMAKTYDLLVQ